MALLDIQIASKGNELPSTAQLQQWVDSALINNAQNVELTIRIVEQAESQQLNYQYRNKDKPTNVLSFPFEVPESIELNLLGDLVICSDIVEQEAKAQSKPLNAHWAHMVIHGCLHLLGYDHIKEDEAQEMEAREIDILSKLGFNNPYLEL